MSCSSALYTVNTASTPLIPNAQVPFGSVIRRFGKNVNLDGDSISVRGSGYYKVDCSITVAPSAAGNITAQLFNDGIAVPGASARAAAAAADEPVNLNIVALVRNQCCDSSDVLSIRIGDVDATDDTTYTVSNMACVVTKI